MIDNVFKGIEIVGTSEESFTHAIEVAVKRARPRRCTTSPGFVSPNSAAGCSRAARISGHAPRLLQARQGRRDRDGRRRRLRTLGAEHWTNPVRPR